VSARPVYLSRVCRFFPEPGPVVPAHGGWYGGTLLFTHYKKLLILYNKRIQVQLGTQNKITEIWKKYMKNTPLHIGTAVLFIPGLLQPASAVTVPVADFGSHTPGGNALLSILFIDKSTNFPTSMPLLFRTVKNE
jgi:hypothetical protein